MNNSFDDVTVEVEFAVIFFQLSRIHKLNYSVGNPVRNNFKKIY
jgi:ssDNA-specific exonuclease RecJ